VYVPEPSDPREIEHLLERALPAPSERVELLAPVLFAFDSDVLEPVGVAMLHEVAGVLKQRADIERLAIQGYADKRGSAEYNRALSLRRAERVKEWLVAHGVAPERLEVQPEGASGFVEPGESELEHQQNRRVIFRVLKLAEEPREP
jgi:outer membrane protein OmpA-like peptidoglycan-associated protein